MFGLWYHTRIGLNVNDGLTHVSENVDTPKWQRQDWHTFLSCVVAWFANFLGVVSR